MPFCEAVRKGKTVILANFLTNVLLAKPLRRQGNFWITTFISPF